MDDHKQRELVTLLADARRNLYQIHDLPFELIPLSNEDGYLVNTALEDELGWEPLGWKVAGTAADVRERLGIDSPIYGRTYRQFAVTSPVRFDFHQLLDPLIECEFFITLNQDLPPRNQPWQMEEVQTAIGEIHAGIEVAECRFPNESLPPLPAILADGAASGRYVYGDQIPRWQDGLAHIEVRLEIEGQERRRGRGSDVMGDPLASLLWLAETFRQQQRGLWAGEMISTGSCTGMLPLRNAQHIIARFGDNAVVVIDIDN